MHSEIQNNTLKISGEVTIKSLNAQLCCQFEQQLKQPEIQILDLSEIAQADSACLSLLLTAQRIRSGSLKISALPAAVQDLAKLYEIEEWISA